ncbi:MAG: ABC transporter substrate-binding protein [Thermoanaerobaculia bacterium]
MRVLGSGVRCGLVLLAALSQAGCGTETAPIRIAVALSPPGPIGAELAAREINASGGVQGRPLELVGPGLGGSEPISTRPDEVLEQAERFATDPSVLAVVGHSDSRSTLTASAVYNQHRLPQLVTIATHPEITGIGDWTYRLCLSDAEQGPALARYAVRSWSRRRVAVFHVNDDYGRGLASRFQEAFRDLGGEVVASVPHRDELGPDDKALLRREIERLRQAGEPDLIALFQRVAAATWTVRALHRAGLRSAVLGGDNLGRSRFLREDPELKEGLRVSQFFVADAGRPWARRFVRAYRKLAGEAPDYGSAFSYDAVYLLRDALEQGGTSRRAIKEYLDRSIAEERPIQGAAGPFILDAAHDARRPLYVVEIRDGSFRLLTTLLANAVAPGNDSTGSP